MDLDEKESSKWEDYYTNNELSLVPLIFTTESDSESMDVSDSIDSDEDSDDSVDVELKENNNDKWLENTTQIREFNFNDRECGVKIDVDVGSTPRDIFDKLFTQNVIQTIVDATNEYGNNLYEGKRPATATKKLLKHEFKDTNEEELMKFFGLCLLQAQNNCPTVRHLFTRDALYFSPIFPYIMSGRRFEQLLRCVNGHYKNEAKNSGKLQKICPILSPILFNFQRAFLPEKEISLDEPFLLFRDRLSSRQQKKEKKRKYDMKFHELTTSDGYVLNIEVDQGKQDVSEKSLKTNDLVFRLIEPYLNKGHHLFMDDFYNNVELSKKLLKYKTHSTGILRSNRKGNPTEIISKNLKKFEHIWRRQGEIYVSKWRDKREILSITTSHYPQMIEVANKFEQKKMKPNDVADYNLHMPGINRCDQMVAYCSSPTKSIRWYKKVIFHILDVAVWNSFYVYRKFHKTAKFLQFRNLLIRSLIQLPDHITGQNLVTPICGRPKTIPSTSPSTSGISQTQHFLEKNLTDSSKRKNVYLRCRECAHNKVRKETRYRCKTCPEKPPLCPECFESYHLR